MYYVKTHLVHMKPTEASESNIPWTAEFQKFHR